MQMLWFDRGVTEDCSLGVWHSVTG